MITKDIVIKSKIIGLQQYMQPALLPTLSNIEIQKKTEK